MKRTFVLSLVVVLVALTFSAAAAQTEPEIPACSDGTISGVIAAYDEETGVVTLNVEGVLCTVTLTDDYDHPIIDLLGAYFGEINLEEIAAALNSLQLCAESVDDNYVVSEPDANGDCVEGVLVTVTGEGAEGGFEATMETGEVIKFETDSEEAAGALTAALETLQADWEVEAGGVGDVGDDIGAYHNDGIGFGVLVKVYAIYEEAQQACAEASAETAPVVDGEETEEAGDEAADVIDPCDVTVELLFGELENMGLGQLFQVYGKPAILGVGHVRNIGDGDGSGDGDSSKGICNARANGGNANATGQPDINCDGYVSDKDKDKDNPDGDD